MLIAPFITKMIKKRTRRDSNPGNWLRRPIGYPSYLTGPITDFCTSDINNSIIKLSDGFFINFYKSCYKQQPTLRKI